MRLFRNTDPEIPPVKEMAKENQTPQAPPREGVISIVGPGMKVIGDCETEGTLRIEGEVEGTVRAAKAVVVGKDGIVNGDIVTQDAVIGGRVTGTVTAESRLELQPTCVVEGEIRARRIKLEEGGRVNGNITMGERVGSQPAASSAGGAERSRSRDEGVLPLEKHGAASPKPAAPVGG